jgi:hypothetical protein
MRLLPRRWALQGSQRLQGSKLMRSVEAYESACGFINATNVNNWRLLHLNAPAIELLGGLTAEGAWLVAAAGLCCCFQKCDARIGWCFLHQQC